MTPSKIAESLRLHGLWLRGEAGGEQADLRGADMRGADPHGADLRYAHMRDANLRDANLRGGNLRGADLREADLRGADLRSTMLVGADLRGAKVLGVRWPAPAMVLLAFWGTLPDHLTVECMRYDAANHPEPWAFDDWADGGSDPYDDCSWQRCVRFDDRQDLWSPGPAKSALELAQALIKERCNA